MILAASPLLTTVLSVMTVLGYGAVAVIQRHSSGRTTRNGLALVWALHGLTLASSLLADPPSFGFAPALSVTAWLALLVYAIESHIYPQLKAKPALLLLGTVSVVLALCFPGVALGLGHCGLWFDCGGGGPRVVDGASRAVHAPYCTPHRNFHSLVGD
jgi:ABC-type uncharacterized transport system permease subunit